MGSGVKRYGGMVADDALSDIFLQNLSSWLGFNRTKVSVSTKKRTASGTSKSPTTSLICF